MTDLEFQAEGDRILAMPEMKLYRILAEARALLITRMKEQGLTIFPQVLWDAFNEAEKECGAAWKQLMALADKSEQGTV